MDDPLDALSKFNREDWAGLPYLIELRGGGAEDGRRFRWHELPTMWRQPERLPMALMFTSASEPSTDPDMRIADYLPTGVVTDDGAHIYELHRYE